MLLPDAWAVVFGMLKILAIQAQLPTAPAGPLPVFEVASIKPMQEGVGVVSGGGCRGIDNPTQFAAGPFTMGIGRCLFNGITLKGLISIAYDLNVMISMRGQQLGADRITGGPDWTDSDKFRIEAKSEDPPATHAQLLQMLQALLADQFKLKFHRGTVEVSGFVLRVAKNGSKLKEPTAAELQKSPFERIGKQGQVSGPMAVSGMIELLTAVLGVPVADQTGLTGRYEVDLKWTSDDPTGAAPVDAAGLSIFTALQEQLGLRLESAKLPAETLVIDSAEKPEED